MTKAFEPRKERKPKASREERLGDGAYTPKVKEPRYPCKVCGWTSPGERCGYCRSLARVFTAQKTRILFASALPASYALDEPERLAGLHDPKERRRIARCTKCRLFFDELLHEVEEKDPETGRTTKKWQVYGEIHGWLGYDPKLCHDCNEVATMLTQFTQRKSLLARHRGRFEPVGKGPGANFNDEVPF